MCADKVSSLNGGGGGGGGGVTGSGLGQLTGALQGGVSKVINTSSTWLDRFFPPEKREQWKEWLTQFATERPYVASFLLSQIAMSGLPLALFALMTVTVVIFALLAGILVGLLGALLFVVGAVGLALLVLLPVLFFTTGAAVFIWLWAVGAYYIVKWFNQKDKDVPGIHSDAAGGLAKAAGLSDLPGVSNGTGDGDDDGHDGHDDSHSHSQSTPKPHHAPAKLDKKDKPSSSAAATGTGTGAQHPSDTKEASTTTHQRKQANHPSSSGPTSKTSDTVNGTGETAD